MTLPAHTSAAFAPATLTAITARLAVAFDAIGKTRMQGVPVMHPGLVVEPVGFEAYVEDDGMQAALGILITPWFMNLISLPLQGQATVAVGCVCERRFGGERLEFIGAHEATFGVYEMCSLFSPMFEFADQATARATASEVLQALRKAPEPLPPPVAIPARRAFLLGRAGGRG